MWAKLGVRMIWLHLGQGLGSGNTGTRVWYGIRLEINRVTTFASAKTVRKKLCKLKVQAMCFTQNGGKCVLVRLCVCVCVCVFMPVCVSEKT